MAAKPPPTPRALEQARLRLDEALAASPDDVRLLVLRGRADERTGHYADAAAFYQRAARLQRRDGDRAGEAASMLDAAAALSRAGYGAEARTAYHRAIGCYELLAMDADVARCRLALARHELGRREYGAARQLLVRCVDPLIGTGDHAELGWVHERLAEIARRDGDVEGALEQARQSVEAAARAKDRTRFGVRLALVGTLHREAGNVVKSRSYLKKALPYLRKADDVAPLLDALLTLADIAQAAGESDRVIEHLEDALGAADAGAGAAERGRVRLRLAEQVAPQGPERARELLEAGVVFLREAGDPRASGPAWLTLATVLQRTGAAEDAVEALGKALVFFEMVGDEQRIAEVKTLRQAAEAGRWHP